MAYDSKRHYEKHGDTNSVEHITWRLMKQRCNNPRNPGYKNYGGRGIRVCERWETYSNFLADMGRRPGKEFSIERIDNDGDYTPENCKWGTLIEQLANRRLQRRNVSGMTHVLWNKATQSWRVRVRGKHYGMYKNLEDAIKRRKEVM